MTTINLLAHRCPRCIGGWLLYDVWPGGRIERDCLQCGFQGFPARPPTIMERQEVDLDTGRAKFEGAKIAWLRSHYRRQGLSDYEMRRLGL